MVDMDLFSTLRLPAHVSVPGRWRRAQEPYTGVQIDHNELLLRSRKTETFASQMAPPCVRKLPRCISGREIFLLTPPQTPGPVEGHSISNSNVCG